MKKLVLLLKPALFLINIALISGFFISPAFASDWEDPTWTDPDGIEDRFATGEPSVDGASNSVFGPNYQVRYPNHTIQAFNIDPPRMNIGCGGIDMHLFSASLASNSEWADFFSAVANSAPLYAARLLMATVCPSCDRVMSELQYMAQQMQQFSMNSCQFTENLYAKARDKSQGAAARNSVHNGTHADMRDASQKASMMSATGVKAMATENLPYADQERALAEMGYGFDMMNNIKYAKPDAKEILPSIIGGRYQAVPDTNSNNNQAVVNQMPPTVSSRQLIYLFMYGADGIHSEKLHFWHCDTFEPGTQICANVTKRPIKETKWYLDTHIDPYKTAQVKYPDNDDAQGFMLNKGHILADVGYFGLIYSLLMQAADNVQRGAEIGTARQVALPASEYPVGTFVNADFNSDQIHGFITYAQINLRPILTQAKYDLREAEALIQRAARLIALQYVQQYITQNLLALDFTSGDLHVDAEMRQRYEQAIQAISKEISAIYQQFVEMEQVMRNWNGEMDRLHEKVYLRVTNTNMVDQYAYSRGYGSNPN